MAKAQAGYAAPARKTRADFSWGVASFFITLTLLLSFKSLNGVDLPTSVLLCTALAGPLGSLVVCYLILAKPIAYEARRTPLLAGLKVARALTLAAVLSYHQHSLPVAAGGRARLLLLVSSKCFALLVGALGFQLPLGLHLWLHGLILALSLALTPERCTRECLAPHVHRLYERFAGEISRGLSSAALLLGLGWGGGAGPAANPCLLVQAWTQIVIGFVLPTAVIDRAEAPPAVWLVPRGRGKAAQAVVLGVPLVANVLQFAGLLAVAAAVCWWGLELVLA